jgi:hypothetical protein
VALPVARELPVGAAAVVPAAAQRSLAARSRAVPAWQLLSVTARARVPKHARTQVQVLVLVPVQVLVSRHVEPAVAKGTRPLAWRLARSAQ